METGTTASSQAGDQAPTGPGCKTKPHPREGSSPNGEDTFRVAWGGRTAAE